MKQAEPSVLWAFGVEIEVGQFGATEFVAAEAVGVEHRDDGAVAQQRIQRLASEIDGRFDLRFEPLEDLLDLVGRRAGQLLLALLCATNQGAALVVRNLLEVSAGMAGQNLVGDRAVGQDRDAEVFDVVVPPTNRRCRQPLGLELGDVVLCWRALKTDQLCSLKIDQGWKPGALAPGVFGL